MQRVTREEALIRSCSIIIQIANDNANVKYNIGSGYKPRLYLEFGESKSITSERLDENISSKNCFKVLVNVCAKMLMINVFVLLIRTYTLFAKTQAGIQSTKLHGNARYIKLVN